MAVDYGDCFTGLHCTQDRTLKSDAPGQAAWAPALSCGCSGHTTEREENDAEREDADMKESDE